MMKNNHSYYFHKLLTECIKPCSLDGKPTLMIGATIAILQEYAQDYAGDLVQGELCEIIESPNRFNLDVEYILEAMECDEKNWKDSIKSRLRNVIARAEHRGKEIGRIQK